MYKLFDSNARFPKETPFECTGREVKCFRKNCDGDLRLGIQYHLDSVSYSIIELFSFRIEYTNEEVNKYSYLLRGISRVQQLYLDMLPSRMVFKVITGIVQVGRIKAKEAIKHERVQLYANNLVGPLHMQLYRVQCLPVYIGCGHLLVLRLHPLPMWGKLEDKPGITIGKKGKYGTFIDIRTLEYQYVFYKKRSCGIGGVETAGHDDDDISYDSRLLKICNKFNRKGREDIAKKRKENDKAKDQTWSVI